MLSSAHLAQLENASRVLLSPLVVADVDAWRREAARSFAELLRADSSMFGLPQAVGSSEGGRSYFFTDTVEGSTLRILDEFLSDPNQFSVAKDPVLDLFFKARDRMDLEVFNIHLMQQLVEHRHHESAFYNEVWVAKRLTGVQMLHVRTAGGYASLRAFYDRGEGPFGEDSLGLLRVLLPSFRAGLDALLRFDAYRGALDAVSEPIAAFDADGRLLHRNPALVRLLDADSERDRVEVELRVLARRLRALAFPRRHDANGAAGAPTVSREVATARGTYVLRGVLLPPSGGGFGEAMLVSVTLDAPPALPDSEAVRARHGLTKREAEVALLLAEGLSNAEIAERLFVSPHTARHHVENVLSKLGINSRAAVAARLLGTA